MKRFRERNLRVLGLVTVVLAVALVYGALEFPKLPLVNDQATYSAYLSDAANLVPRTRSGSTASASARSPG